MPEVDLSGRQAGFFGKLPTSGDFVARGLPGGLRRPLDRWLVRRFAAGSEWPDGGWRAVLPWRGAALTLLVLPSADRTNRSFPLAALCHTPAVPDPSAAEAWADAALAPCLAAATGELEADALAATLSSIAPPSGPAERPAEALIWPAGHAQHPTPTEPIPSA